MIGILEDADLMNFTNQVHPLRERAKVLGSGLLFA